MHELLSSELSCSNVPIQCSDLASIWCSIFIFIQFMDFHEQTVCLWLCVCILNFNDESKEEEKKHREKQKNIYMKWNEILNYFVHLAIGIKVEREGEGYEKKKGKWKSHRCICMSQNNQKIVFNCSPKI